MDSVFNMQRKKGNPKQLDGRVTVYAKIDMDPEEFITMKHPVATMVHGGLLAVQGNYREQNSLRDFLRNEMGISLDREEAGDGLREMIENLDGIESALDPQKLRERLENMGDFEDFIPTPAKVVPFHSEPEILSQEGDIYFAGHYKGIGNAVLAINAIPIVYQALFREQLARALQNEIDSLISQIEGDESVNLSIASPEVNPEEALLKIYIPSMLYQRIDPTGLTHAKKQFRSFMRGYRFNDDVEAVSSLITKDRELGATDYKLLELYAKKIALVQTENFAEVESVRREIVRLSGV